MLGARAVFVKGQDVRDGAVERRRHSHLLSEFDHAAGQPAHFEPIAALQIMMHGRRHVGCDIVGKRKAAFGIVFRQVDPMGATDRDDLRMTSSRNWRVCASRESVRLERASSSWCWRGRQKYEFLPDSRRMSGESSALMPPLRQACRNASPRAERRPSNSPKELGVHRSGLTNDAWAGRSLSRHSRRRP